MSVPVVAAFGEIHYQNSRGTPSSSLRVNFAASGGRYWEITADYSMTPEYLQLSQLKSVLTELDKIVAEDPAYFNGVLVVTGLLDATYDLLSRATTNYSLVYLVQECLDLVTARNVVLGISAP